MLACSRPPLTFTLGGGPKSKAADVVVQINPEGTFDGFVEVSAHDDTWVALAYDDSECSVALLVERASAKVVANSGCQNSRYCRVKALPAPQQCQLSFVCDDGAGGLQKREADICAAPAPAPALPLVP